ncbi:MAG TPA: PEP-CTERM sorting domain-containing protein [Planctomycetota bacterium]|nr:PEP-CTERM sorting domain-containing protein [Planctomycetota bacterium]
MRTARLAAGVLMLAASALPALAVPFEVVIDIGPPLGQVEAGAVASGGYANLQNGQNLATTALTTPGGDPFTLAINNLNAAGSPIGGIDWRDRGNAGTASLLRLGEDFVKNNLGIVRVTLGNIPAGSYAVNSYHIDPDNTQCEAIKVLLSDASTAGFWDTGARGNANISAGGVGGLSTGEVTASGASFFFTSNGTDDVVILFDGSTAADDETPLNGISIRPASAAHVYTPLATGKASLEQAGRVVMEAENFTARTTNPGETAWVIKPTENSGTTTVNGGPIVSNYRGTGYIQSLPDQDSAGGGGYLNDPTATYQMQISTPGTYRAYLRWDGNNNAQGESDSIYIDIVDFKDGAGGSIADWYELTESVNGNFASPTWDGGGGFEENLPGASGNAMTWNISIPGIYTFRITQREDGSAVDAIILQLSNTTPGNPGPAESNLSNGLPILTGYSKLGGDPDATHPLGVASGLVEGAKAFADAPGNWTGIPLPLLGSDYIMTESNDAGTLTAGYGFVDYSVKAVGGAALYLFLDDRYIAANGLPSWMVGLGFMDIGLDVLLDDQISQLPFSIFQMASPMADGVPISVYGLGYQLNPGYEFYGIAVSDYAFTAIPEPATSALVALGIIALVRRRRRATGKA